MSRRRLLRTLFAALLFLPSLGAKGLFVPAAKRRYERSGWRDMWQSFYYFDYDAADEMGWGVLRVLDDFTMHSLDGTPIHPHRNMEIVTLMLEGEIYHQDSLGNSGLLRAGEVQLMSAGSGLKHAEVNPSRFALARGLQIWISPDVRNTQPRYQQKRFSSDYFQNRLAPFISAYAEEEALVMQQKGRVLRAVATEDRLFTYRSDFAGHAAYLFVIQGEAELEGSVLRKRDALGLQSSRTLTIKANKGSDLLLFDLPSKGEF